MVWIPAGWFQMGSEEVPFADSKPVHRVHVDGFWMDQTEVTNAQYARFVEETSYKTYAEEPHDGLAAGSFVFKPPSVPVSADNPYQWWKFVEGANWRHPEGPESTIVGRENHPVVHVSWNDAVAYCEWRSRKEGATVRLPTEAEWERAARGGLEGKRYVWGDELKPDGKWMANIWQGRFPYQNTEEDGYRTTAPVGSYPPNGFGLYDMAGNVWEWCLDWYRPDYYLESPERNPTGPDKHSSFDPQESTLGPKHVQRGGSFMCSDEYCIRYVPAGRGKGEPTSASFHIGFRCVRLPSR
jgi:formylglycine-generating enzyme required for sulfatase activity